MCPSPRIRRPCWYSRPKFRKGAVLNITFELLFIEVKIMFSFSLFTTRFYNNKSQSKPRLNFLFRYVYIYQACLKRGGRGGVRPPVFGRPVKPILTRGGTLSPTSTARPPPPDFQTLRHACLHSCLLNLSTSQRVSRNTLRFRKIFMRHLWIHKRLRIR